jgi:hypothetical protein
MSDITRTKAQVGLVKSAGNALKEGIAGAAIEAGQPVYFDSNGKLQLADANGSGTDKFDGIALNDAGIGGAVTLLVEGEAEGFTLAGAYRSAVYVSNTVGELADSAGGTSLQVGRVVPCWSSGAVRKVLQVTGQVG